ncbi:MAG: potassium channel family protein [Acidimicrobiales bacterium]|nr:potassium channel family protein [Acidimicrobiales bacterium]
MLSRSRRWRVAVGVALVAVVTMSGAFWYAVVEGFGAVDALYQSVITVSTVGFGEIEPLDTSGRLFTIGLIIVGVAAIGFALAAFAEILVESALEQLTTRRRGRTLDRLSKHTLVCGYGRTGQAVLDLLPPGLEVGVVEREPDRAAAAERAGRIVIQADCTRDETLLQAGIERADGLIVCLANDSDAISTVLSARAANADLRIVTRASDAHSASKMRLAGADQVVSPIDMAARRLVSDSVQPELAGFLDTAMHDPSTDVSIRAVRVHAASAAAGMALPELEAATGVRIIGSQTDDGQVLHAASIVAGTDQIVFAVGLETELLAFEALSAAR